MRVISGSSRGKKLFSLEGTDTRPTTDRVKESIFNIISPYIYGSTVLDLFAGSGALGIEALSRGANLAVFCEKGRKAIEIIEKNLSATGLLDKAIIEKTDFFEYLSKSNCVFDIIFIDPPYASGFYDSALSVIAKRCLLSDDGIIITERSSDLCAPSGNDFELVTDRRYGNSTVSIFKRLESKK